MRRSGRFFAFWGGCAALFVLLSTGSAGAVTIDPVATPVNITTITVTGTMDSNDQVTVTCPGASLGSVNNPTPTTWSVQVSGLPEGTSTITATADGEDPPNAQATILVDTTPPSLSVSALPDGAYTNNPILNISGTASDSGSGLAQVTVNRTPVTVTNGSFSTSVTLALGTNTITTVASDQAGNTETDTRTITLDETAPQITIAQPADNSATNVSPLTVSGTVDKTAVVNVAVNGGSSQAATQDNDGFTVQVPLAEGTNTISITATDQAGNIASAKRTVLYDTISPTIQITEPPQDLVTNQANYLVQGTVSDPETSVTVAVAVNGQSTPVTVSSGTFQLSVPLTVNELYQVVATATDTAGNQASATRNITFDNIPPTITKAASSTSTGYYGPGSSVDVSLSFSEPVYSSGLTITLSSGAALTTGALSAVTSFDTSYQVAAGQNTAQLNVTNVTGTISDLAGNQNQNPSVPVGANIGNVVQIAIETTPPTATLTSEPANPANTKTGSFTFTLDVAGATAQCALDNTVFNTCSSPFAFDLSNQPDGSHTFSVRGVDQAGNIGTPNSYSWAIDTTPPTITQAASTTAAGYYGPQKSIDVSLAFSEPVNSSGLTITLSSGATLTTGALSAATSIDTTYVVAAGQNTAQLNVTSVTGTISDLAGNQNQAPLVPAGSNIGNKVQIVIETTPPTVTFTSKPANPTNIKSGSFTFTLSVAGATAQCAIDSVSAFNTCSSPFAFDFSNQPDGNHTFSVRGIDQVGNVGAVNTYSWTINTTSPTVSAGPDKTSSSQFTQTGTVSDASAYTVQWSQQSGPGTITFGTPTALSTTVSASQDGQYVLLLTATDAAGNTATNTMTLIWDTVKPLVNAGANKTSGISFSQTGTVSDSLPVTVQWSRVSGPGTVTFGSPTALTTTVSASQDGQYVLQLTATDSAGNVAASTMTLTWDTVKPLVNAGANQTYGIQFTQTGTVSDSLPVTEQWSQVSGPGTVAFTAPTSLTTQVSATQDGQYVLLLTATDSAGNVGSATMSLTWDTVKPVVSAGTNQVANSSITITGSASDTLNQTYHWSQTSGPGTVSFSAPNSLTTQVTANQNGQYVLQLTATDSAGNTAASTMNLTWDTVSPVVSAGPNLVTNGTGTITITGSASDALGLTYQWNQVSVSPGPGTVSFTASNSLATQVTASQDGLYTLQLTATDAAGNTATSTMTLTWDTTPPSMTVSALQNGAYTNNPILNVAGTAGDSGSGLAQVTVNGKAVTVTNGSFSTSVTLAVGANIITTVASDQAGNTTTDTRTITLDETAPQITIAQPADNSATNVSPLTVSGSVNKTASVNVAVNGGSSLAATPQDNNGFTVQVPLAAGTNTITITATDQAGNFTTAKRTVLYDTVNPTIQITEPPQDLVTNQANYLVQGTVSDPQTSVTVVVSVDGQSSPVTVSSSGAFELSVPLTVNKSYQVVATATDAAGNQASATRNITFDNIPPTITQAASTTAAGYYDVGNKVDVSLAFSEPVYSSSGLTITLSSGATLTTGPLSAVTSFDTSYVVAAGQNTAQLNVTAVTGTISDLAGNQSLNPGVPTGANIGNVVQIAIETTQPTITQAASTTAAGYYGTGSKVDVSLAFSVPVNSSGLTITLSSGATLTTGALSAATSFDTTYVVAAGQNTAQLNVTAITGTISDLAGNQNPAPGAPAVNIGNKVQIAIDTIPPNVSAGSNVTSGIQFTQTGTASDSLQVTTVQWSKQSGPGQITFGTATALATTVNASQDGQYVLLLTATDAAGNTATSTMNLTWDTVKPVVSAGANQTYGIQFTQTGTASDSLQVTTVQWSQVSGPGTITFGTPTALSTTVSASQDGQYVLQLTATDSAGNVGSATTTLTWDTVKPVVVAGTNRVTNGTITITGSASDTLGLTYQWSQVSVSPGPGTVTFSAPNSLTTQITANQDGVYTLQLTATDSAGNVAASTMTLTWDQSPPVITLPAKLDGSFTADNTLTLNGVVTDQTSGIDHFTINGTTIALDPAGAYSTSVTLNLGANVITAYAIDLAGNVATQTLTVNYDPTVPQITLTAPSSDDYYTNQSSITIGGMVGTQCTVTITVSDSGNPPQTLQTITNVTVTPSNTSYSFTQKIDSLPLGRSTITITAATQAALVSTKDVSVTYETAKPVLTVDSPAGDVRSITNSITVGGTASDPMTDVAVTILVDGIAAPNQPELVNGTYSQAVPLATNDVHTITVQATNEAGNQTTLTRRVINVAPTGDINGDGIVNAADALMALQVAVGLRKPSDSYLVYGDVGPLGPDGNPAPDWKIDISDAVVILRISVGSVTLKK
ncbi:MAG: Ig-like domain-containing protein [Oryzomonas sp.]|uniref:Ig-like domain-containing protein n=1 Tax=Oryzomonas sp. TaxID=2855186 RepID=UPI00283C0FF4|nr:Ig-like domain-containing protein [Oryzomonas sp.]MDR3578684.1 Ig-like domain-containing protein [Oryzomonas sp.]